MDIKLHLTIEELMFLDEYVNAFVLSFKGVDPEAIKGLMIENHLPFQLDESVGVASNICSKLAYLVRKVQEE